MRCLTITNGMWKLFVQCADNMHKNNGTIENIYRSMHFAQLSQSAAVKYELAKASYRR